MGAPDQEHRYRYDGVGQMTEMKRIVNTEFHSERNNTHNSGKGTSTHSHTFKHTHNPTPFVSAVIKIREKLIIRSMKICIALHCKVGTAGANESRQMELQLPNWHGALHHTAR